MSTTIDAQNDTLVSVRHLARQRLGKNIAPSTVWRWARKGCRGVKLECVQVLGAWHTTPEAFARFVNGQTAAALGRDAPVSAPAPRSPEKIDRLKKAGLLRGDGR